MRLILVFAMFVLQTSATLYTTVQSGNWCDTNGAGATSPWCSSGTCAIPGAGDSVHIAAGHILTVASGCTAVIGSGLNYNASYGSWSDAGWALMGTSDSAGGTLVVDSGGSLTYRGSVHQDAQTWTVNGSLLHDGTANSMSYLWNTACCAAGSPLIIDGGTWKPVAGSPPMGQFGAGDGMVPDAGNLQVLNGGLVDHLGIPSATAISGILTDSNGLFACINSTISNSATFDYKIYGSGAQVHIDHCTVLAPTSTGDTGLFYFESGTGVGLADGNGYLRNSWIQGTLAVYGWGSKFPNIPISDTFFESRPDQVGSYGPCCSTPDAYMPMNRIFVYGREPDSSHYGSLNVTGTSSDVYVLTGLLGSADYSAATLSAQYDPQTWNRWTWENLDADRGTSILRGSTSAFTTINLSNLLVLPNAVGVAPGKTIAILGTPSAGTTLVSNMTFPSDYVGLGSTGVGAIAAWEAGNGVTGMFSVIANNLAWRAAPGLLYITHPAADASGAAGTFQGIDYNATWHNDNSDCKYYNGTLSTTYANPDVRASGGCASPHDLGETLGSPQWVDSTRRAVLFPSAYFRMHLTRGLNDDGSGVVPDWNSGATYSVGQLVYHAHAGYMGGLPILWRCAATGTTGSAEEPGVTSGNDAPFLTWWEPYIVQLMRTHVLTPAVPYDGLPNNIIDGGMGCNGTGCSWPLAVSNWVRAGWTPQNRAFYAAGCGSPVQGGSGVTCTGTTYVGAIPPIAPQVISPVAP